MEDGKILLVEDESFLAHLLKNRLEKEGMEVTIVSDGEEALNILKKESFHLILLDLILPKISGFELMEIISADPKLKKIPIMVISNLGQDKDIATAKDYGVVDYFVKARVSIDELVEQIKKFLREN